VAGPRVAPGLPSVSRHPLSGSPRLLRRVPQLLIASSLTRRSNEAGREVADTPFRIAAGLPAFPMWLNVIPLLVQARGVIICRTVRRGNSHSQAWHSGTRRGGRQQLRRLRCSIVALHLSTRSGGGCVRSEARGNARRRRHLRTPSRVPLSMSNSARHWRCRLGDPRPKAVVERVPSRIGDKIASLFRAPRKSSARRRSRRRTTPSWTPVEHPALENRFVLLHGCPSDHGLLDGLSIGYCVAPGKCRNEFAIAPFSAETAVSQDRAWATKPLSSGSGFLIDTMWLSNDSSG
jgi:hypothetical protein